VTIAVPRHRHSPLIRRLSKELGVDADSVAGSGPGGRVRADDLRTMAQLRSTSEQTDRVVDVSASREPAVPDAIQATAAAGQLTSVIEVDLTGVGLLIARSRDQNPTGTEVTLLAFVAKAAAEALRLFPLFNASADRSGTVKYNDAVRLGIAIDAETGSAVRSIERADDLSVSGLARQIAGVGETGGAAGRAGTTEGTNSSASSAGDGRRDERATFTISDSGRLGTSFNTPVVDGPQLAALGIGAVVRRPAVVVSADGSDTITVRSLAFLSLSYDRRFIDSVVAARFLATVRNRLELSAVDLLLR